jgi:sulfatase modifying factor 1
MKRPRSTENRIAITCATALAAVWVTAGPAVSQGKAGAARRAPSPVPITSFAIDPTEVTVAAFSAFLDASGRKTAAEREGGGFEYAAGWTRRKGWTWAEPYGQPAQPTEPAVHVTWREAADYCNSRGGRLPTFEEWASAAYHEKRTTPTDGLVAGRVYPYPVGETPDGMHTSAKRHRPVATTRRGVNGLYDMGANVWEWIADRRGEEALTAGGSWWYGPNKTRRTGAQWKPADFYAVYIGFRCAYDLPSTGLRDEPGGARLGAVRPASSRISLRRTASAKLLALSTVITKLPGPPMIREANAASRS